MTTQTGVPNYQIGPKRDQNELNRNK